jgi:hypothetical protein
MGKKSLRVGMSEEAPQAQVDGMRRYRSNASPYERKSPPTEADGPIIISNERKWAIGVERRKSKVDRTRPRFSFRPR